MKTLSTGQPSTLKTYYDNCLAFFGPDSPATEYFKDKIEKQGEDEEVLADEQQMMVLIYKLVLK